uniref:Alternative protein CHSY1 n=1 Tax=Homo sapiens TaxID=9606 RepID=L8E844_HUMAN|nr:alternative protein CHSY1 [Homo sapiens]
MFRMTKMNYYNKSDVHRLKHTHIHPNQNVGEKCIWFCSFHPVCVMWVEMVFILSLLFCFILCI